MAIKSLLIPNKDNKYLPRIIGFKALVLYAFLSVIVFALIYPFFTKTYKMLASLTQELIIQQVNPVRESRGFLALEANERLTEAAQMKAEDMIERDYFSHTSPGDEPPWIWLKKVDYSYAAAAENLAIDASDPKVLVNAWLASPSHAKNILNGYFTDIGIGIAKGELGGKKTTVVVMYLGREIRQNAHSFSSIIEDAVQKPEDLTITPDESIKNTPPEEPVATQTVENDVLHEDNVAITAGNLLKEEERKEEFQNIGAKIFLLNAFPYEARFALTVFFNIIIFWTLATLFISRENFLTRTLNSLMVLAFLFFLWLPEII